MKTEIVKIDNPEGKYQVVIGQANFSVFTTDDLYRALLTAVPGIKLAVAMNEAVPKLTRVTGNDKTLQKLASENCLKIGASHVFVVMTENAFPLNILNTIKLHPAVACVYVASANPMEVIVAETELGRAVLGVVDGNSVNAIETDEEREERRKLCDQLGYGYIRF